ncbi:MAG: MarR family transcriptional regulator [Actinomycetaceae bacterium]|nr:MarR family transcriptional regulator [Actinomycetaceae bacterium]
MQQEMYVKMMEKARLFAKNLHEEKKLGNIERVLMEKYHNSSSVSVLECHVLSSINDDGYITAARLAEQHSCTRGAMSKILARLEKKGFLSIFSKEENKKKIFEIDAIRKRSSALACSRTSRT